MKIGFIGLGSMGWGMATNARTVASEFVVQDTSEQRMTDFAAQNGAVPAQPFSRLGNCELIITMLPTGLVVREVMLGAGGGTGLADLLAPGSIVVDMSSSEPMGTRELGAVLRQRCITLLDAPVSGGMPRANDGTLTIMLGADDEAAADRVEPVMLAMGSRVFRTGPLGSGHAMKALNNYVGAASFAATAEAILIGRRFGLDGERMIDIMNMSTGKNFNSEIVMKDHVINQKFATGFKIGLLAKDVRITAGLAEQMNISAPVLDLITSRWEQARDALGADHDNSEAILAWDEDRVRPDRA